MSASILLNVLILIGGINCQTSILFTSNWSGIITDAIPVMNLVFGSYGCNGTFSVLYPSTGLSLLSPISLMTVENTRLVGSNIKYEIGENNTFINFVLPPSPNLVQILQMYPNDNQLIQMVITAVNAIYDPNTPKQNIMIVLSRNNDVNNLNVNNYKNIVQQINQLNWFNVKFLDYQSADNVVYQLRRNPYYNIITLLIDPSNNRDLIQKAYLANLMVWRYRWIIVNLLGEYDLLGDSTKFGNGVLTNNVTVITFADQLTRKTGRSVLLEDSLKMVRTTECDASKPIAFLGMSGSINVSPITRSTFIYAIYKNPGANVTSPFYINHDLIVNQFTFPPAFKFVPFTMNSSNSLTLTKQSVFRIGFVDYPPFSYKINNNYTGFLIDLLVEILTGINVPYTFIDLVGTNTGSLNSTTLLYNELLGNVQNGVVDTLSIPFVLTINKLNYFDYSSSIFSGYFSVLYKNRTYTGISALVTYVLPFDWTVWVTFLGSAMGVAIALTITDHIFPDKYARYKFLMSLFFSFSSLTHGAYFDPPRKLGGRIIMSFWWLFCLVVVILWACNYAAFLAQSRNVQQLTTFFALLNQKTYRYGTLNDSMLFNFLAINNDTSSQSMLQIMSENTVNGTVNDIISAVNLVINDTYSFIYTDRIIMYLKNKYCLDMFGAWMGFEYGILFPKNSEKTMIISSEITKKSANGSILSLRNKYWPVFNSSCMNTNILDNMTDIFQTLIPNYFNNALDFNVMIGVFVILLGGAICCLVLALIERFIRYLLQRRVEARDKYDYDYTVEQLTKF